MVADTDGNRDMAGWLQVLSPNSKAGLKLLTVSLGIAIGLLWYLAFVQELSWLASPAWWFAPLAAITIGFSTVLVFADDKLYYDGVRNPYAQAFQKSFPSTFIACQLKMPPEDARNLWFKSFNVLRDPKHPNHDQWKRTFQRGYQCRLVYFFLRIGALAFSVSGILIVTESVSRFWFNTQLFDPASFGRRLVFTCAIGVLWFVVRVKNRVRLDHLTGVWRRFEEINLLNTAWARENIPELKAAIASEAGETE